MVVPSRSTIDLTCEELLAKQPLELVLVPEEMPVTLRMDFGDGRTMEQEIMLEKSSPEYCRLRAGSFHGFRAHRLMGHEPEIYNVDLTTAAANVVAEPRRTAEPVVTRQQPVKPVAEPEVKPAEPVQQPVQQPAEEPQQPVVNERPTKLDRPKSAAELRAEKLRADIPQKATDDDRKAEEEAKRKERAKKFAYLNDRPEKVDILKDDPDDDEETKHKSLSPMIIAAVVVVLITAGIVWYLFNLIPSDSNNGDNTDEYTAMTESNDNQERISVIDDVPDVTASDKEKSAEPQQPAAASTPITPEEKADIEYLNSHNVWRPADMKSDKFRRFFELFAQGDIDGLANSDYYAVADMATNQKAIQIIDFVWKSKGTFQENNNRKVLKSTSGNESIDLSKIVDDLARRQDKTPYSEPRPKR